MPTIRDLVLAIAERDEVEAVVVMGRDGLLIEGRTSTELDSEHLAALLPAVVIAADSVGEAAARGPVVTAVLEFEHGMALVSSIASDAILLVVVHHGANVGSLLYELRRHRANIAALV